MINENEFNYEEMTNEELAAKALRRAMNHAQITLQLSENCYRKFGERIISDEQTAIFKKIASGILLTDEEMEVVVNEQITASMEAVVYAREADKQAAVSLGEAYTPELVFQDRTDESVN
jgi:hypothetical protein